MSATRAGQEAAQVRAEAGARRRDPAPASVSPSGYSASPRGRFPTSSDRFPPRRTDREGGHTRAWTQGHSGKCHHPAVLLWILPGGATSRSPARGFPTFAQQLLSQPAVGMLFRRHELPTRGRRHKYSNVILKGRKSVTQASATQRSFINSSIQVVW